MRYRLLYYRHMHRVFALFRLYQYSPSQQVALCASPAWHTLEEGVFQAHEAGDVQTLQSTYQRVYQLIQGPRLTSSPESSDVRQGWHREVAPFPLGTGSVCA